MIHYIAPSTTNLRVYPNILANFSLKANNWTTFFHAKSRSCLRETFLASGLGAFDNPFLTQGPSIIIAYATCVDWGHRAGDKAMVQQQARADGIQKHGLIEDILQGLLYVYVF